MVSADYDRQRRSVKVRPFPYLCKSLTALDGDQADGLEVGCCRRNMGSLQNLLKLFFLHLFVLIAPDRITLLCNFDKIHSGKSSLSIVY